MERVLELFKRASELQSEKKKPEEAFIICRYILKHYPDFAHKQVVSQMIGLIANEELDFRKIDLQEIPEEDREIFEETLVQIGIPIGKKKSDTVKKILVVVDMQNDFIDGSLGTAEALEIIEPVKEKIRSYPKDAVYVTMDTHGEDYLETQEGKNLPAMHCIRGSKGWEMREDVAELLDGAAIYEKPSFASVLLAEDLQRLNETESIEVELVGLCTDICVVINALLLKAYMPEVKISVDASCCAGVTPEKHLAALETLRSCQINVK